MEKDISAITLEEGQIVKVTLEGGAVKYVNAARDCTLLQLLQAVADAEGAIVGYNLGYMSINGRL